MKAVMSKVLLKATMSPACTLMCTYYYLYYQEEVLLRGDSIVCGVWCGVSLGRKNRLDSAS
jgi:hypothetical protein